MDENILTYLKDNKNYNALVDSTQNGVLKFVDNFYDYGDRSSDNAIYNNKKPFGSSADVMEINPKIESQFALVKKSNSFGIFRKKVSDVTYLGKFTSAVFYVNDDCSDNSNGMEKCHAGGITYAFETNDKHESISTFDFKNKLIWKIVDITKLKEKLLTKSNGGKSNTRRRRKQNKRKRTTRR